MSFTDKKGMGGSDYTALFIALGLTTAIGIPIVTANLDKIAKAAQELKTFDVEEPPPPPEKLPPPPPKQDLPPPPVVAPPPIVQTNIAPPQSVITQATPPPVFVPTPEPPRPAPPPPPPLPVVSVAPRGDPNSWFSPEDIPSSVKREQSGVIGVTRFHLEIDGTGKPTNCSVTGSSGNSLLDDTTCKLAMRRARFKPGRDTAGNAIGGIYNKSVRWQIE